MGKAAKTAAKFKGSSTPGKSKGWNCKKTPQKVQFCKDSKMIVKDGKGYVQVEDLVFAMNGFPEAVKRV